MTTRTTFTATHPGRCAEGDHGIAEGDTIAWNDDDRIACVDCLSLAPSTHHDVLDNWHGSPDAATWTADGPHETKSDHHPDDYPPNPELAASVARFLEARAAMRTSLARLTETLRQTNHAPTNQEKNP